MKIELRRGTDQVVTLPGLRTTATPPAYLNAATVRATLFDPSGVPVAGRKNVAMAYVGGSNGDYELLIDGVTFMLPASPLYKLVIVAAEGAKDYRAVCTVAVVD